MYKLPTPVLKALLSALSERDESAEVCPSKGEPKLDPDLRDYENVPLNDDIDAYPTKLRVISQRRPGKEIENSCWANEFAPTDSTQCPAHRWFGGPGAG